MPGDRDNKKVRFASKKHIFVRRNTEGELVEEHKQISITIGEMKLGKRNQNPNGTIRNVKGDGRKGNTSIHSDSQESSSESSSLDNEAPLPIRPSHGAIRRGTISENGRRMPLEKDEPSAPERSPKPSRPSSFTQTRSGGNLFSAVQAAPQPQRPNPHQLKQQRKEVHDLARELVRFNPTLKGKIFAPKKTIDQNGNACLVIDTRGMNLHDKHVLAGLTDAHGQKLFTERHHERRGIHGALSITPTLAKGEKTAELKQAITSHKQHQVEMIKLKKVLFEFNPHLKKRINTHRVVDEHGRPALVINTQGLSDQEIEVLTKVKDTNGQACFLRTHGKIKSSNQDVVAELPVLKYLGEVERVSGVLNNIEALTEIEHTLKHFSFRFRHGFELSGDGSVTFDNSHVNNYSKQSKMMKELLKQSGWVEGQGGRFELPADTHLKNAAKALSEKAKQPSKSFQLQQQLG